MNYQKAITISIGLFLLTTFLGCTTNETFHFNPHGNQIEFDYPLGWNILYYDSSPSNNNDYIEKVANSKVINSSTTYINGKGYIFDLGEHDFGLPLTITDTIFENTPSAREYIEKMQIDYEDKGTIETYTSKNNVDFTVWKVSNLAYEGEYTFYFTNYVDSTGNKHLVEIMNIGEAMLIPLINSLTLPS